MLRRILPFVVVLAGAPCAVAAIIKVPQQHATIQGAINAANPGDTIRISAGIYQEPLSISKPLIIEAKGNAIIEGRKFGVNLGAGINISGNGAGTVLKGITVRLCMETGILGTGILAVSNDLTFEKVRVVGCGGVGILVNGTNIVLRKCVVEGCDGGIYATVNKLLLDSCIVRNDASRGIRMSGVDCAARKCIVDTIRAGSGIQLDSSNGDVEQCIVRRVYSNPGLYVTSPNSRARKNVISSIGNDGQAVRVSAANFTFENNIVRDVIAQGVYVDTTGVNATIRGNQFLRIGAEAEPAIDCLGAGCLVSKNVIRDADGAGIRMLANQGIVQVNTIQRCRLDGIYVASGLSGVQVTDNLCIAQLGEGIDVRSSSTIVTGNVAKQNRTDFATNLMNFSVDPSNAFGTTGAPEVD